MNKLKTNEQTQKNEYGYVNQKGNRWFIKVDGTIHLNSGFKSLDQFEEWIKEEFRKQDVEWRMGYTWQYKKNLKVFELANKLGKTLTRW